MEGAFDLLVVGGGIYGAWTAWDAALRGLRVALIEAGDWGGATSSRSSKLLHGGLRYLERGDVGLVRKSLGERERLLRLAPHRTWPLCFAVPATPQARYRGLPLALGLWAYDALAPRGLGDRAARRWARREVAQAAPFLAAGTAGAWTYADAGTDDARLVLELVAGAMAAGAVAVNGARATGWVETRGRITGATLQVDGRTVVCRAAMTVVTGGPWAASLAGLSSSAVRFTKGVHLCLPPLPLADPWEVDRTAFLLTHPVDGRVFFLIPWYGRTLVGTTDTDTADPYAGPTAADVEYLLAGVQAACPGLGWGREHVTSAWAGVRTLLAAQGHASSVSREWAMFRPSPGLLVSLGGKLTSARVEADHLVTSVLAALGREPVPCPTRTMPLPWCPSAPWDGVLAQAVSEGASWGLSRASAVTAARRYGARLPALWRHLAAHPGASALLDPGLPFLEADLQLAQEEMLLPGASPLTRLPWDLVQAPGSVPGVDRSAAILH